MSISARKLTRNELPKTLEGWIPFFNDEYGEYLSALSHLLRYKNLMSDELDAAVKQAVEDELGNLTRAHVYEITETVTSVITTIEVEF